MNSMHSRFHLLASIVGSLTFALFASCSDDDDSGGGGPVPGNATVDVLIGDAAVDDLSAFSADVESVRLRDDTGVFTTDLLPAGAIEVEFLRLNGAQALLVRGTVPEDTYDAIEVGFTPGAYEARAEDGSDVTVTASSDVLLLAFPAPLVLSADEYARVEVDLDLPNSLSGDVSAGDVDLDPTGTVVTGDGSTETEVVALKGLVTDSDAGAGTVTVDAFADDSQVISLGEATVRTVFVDLFLDTDGSELTSTDFFNALVDNQTLLEVHGTLGQSGEIDATRIDIEDQSGGAGSANDVRIRGTIVSTAVDAFTLRIRDVNDGESVADPILAGLGDPAEIDVSYDTSTVFVLGGTEVADSTELLVGRTVEVRFCDFATEPFPACVVDVSDEPVGFEGLVTDVAGLPNSFVMHLDADDPAISGGLVQDELTDVTVDLTGSTIVLDAAGDPVLVADDIVADVEITAEGTISGGPTTPTLTATRTVLAGGRLSGALVTTNDELTSSFTTTGGDILDPFGANVTAGTQTVLIEPTATFTGDVSTKTEFFDLLDTVAGANALIGVHGLGTANTNEIRAFEIDVRVP